MDKRAYRRRTGGIHLEATPPTWGGRGRDRVSTSTYGRSRSVCRIEVTENGMSPAS
jgi:hypothetical protein